MTLSSNNTSWGTVSGGGTYNEGTSVTATATPQSGYQFVNWTEGGTQVSTSASYTFTLNGNRTLVANFEAIPVPTYTVTFSVNVSDAIITFNGVTNPAGNYTFTGIEAGTYQYTISREGYNDATGTVTVTNNNVTVTVNITLTGIEDVNASKVVVYSQNGNLTIKSDSEPIARIEIFNLSGQLLRAVSGSGNLVEISSLPQKQALIVRITFTSGQTINKKIIG